MERPKLVIASILKPVNDTRMYEKFALSLSQANKYEINIIGFLTKNIPVADNIFFHPIFHFKRLSVKRLFAPLVFMRRLVQIKPSVIIITTHELLIPACFYVIFNRSRLIYDIRENYYKNIKYTKAFPTGIKQLLALWVRTKEWLTKPIIEQYLLAERYYALELPFIKGKFTIIENKAIKAALKTHKDKERKTTETRLLFSGTLASTTGVFTAIEIAKKLHDLDSNITLKIVGFCARKEELKLIKYAVHNHDFISLVGGGKLVDHTRINLEIDAADFGIIYYPKNRANDNAIPTKLYEYLGSELPIITTAKSRYQELANPYNAAIYLDFQSPDYERLLHKMENNTFYEIKPGNEVFWQNEEAKLLQLL